MEINQVYKAPGIPKISRRNIKSSVFSGATESTTPLLKKTSFSFIRSAITPRISRLSPADLQPIQSKSEEPRKFGIEKILEQTNKALLDVHKQLKLDFLDRFLDQKKELDEKKKKRAQQKIASKEKSIEGVGKISAGASKVFDKIGSPIRSVFEKILDFFSIIVTGLIANNAFNWLSKPENQKRIGQFIGFLAEHWREILIILGTIKLLGAIRTVVKVAKALKGLIDLVSGKKPPTPSGGFKIPSKIPWGEKNPASLSRRNESFAKFIQGTSNLGDRARLLRRGMINPTQIFTKGGIEALEKGAKPNLIQKGFGALKGFGDKLGSKLINPIIDVVLPKLPPKVKTEVAEAVAKKGIKRFIPYVNVLFGSVEAVSRLMSGDIEGALISMASAIPIVGWGALALDIYRSVDPEGYQKNIRFGLSSEEINKSIGEGFNMIGSVGMSDGGTVGQGDRPGKDTTPAILRGGSRIDLDAGEEVIRTSESMRWRPLLKDINNNGARMWMSFSQGVKKQENVIGDEYDTTFKLNDILQSYDKSLKEESKRLKEKYLKTSQKITPSPSPSPPTAPTLPPSSGSAPSAGAAGSQGAAGAAGSAGAAGAAGSQGATGAVGPAGSTVPIPDLNTAPSSDSNVPNSAITVPQTSGTQLPAPIEPVTKTESDKIPLLPWKGTKDQEGSNNFNFKSYFSSASNNLSASGSLNKVSKDFDFSKLNVDTSPSAPTVINMPLPPITVDNSKSASIPQPSGDPTPLPKISSINTLYEEDLALTAVTLGILA